MSKKGKTIFLGLGCHFQSKLKNFQKCPKLSKNHKDKILHDAAVIMEAYLKEKKGLFPNTDFFHAQAYHYLGIQTKLFTPLFAIARIIGWSAHAYEQRDNNRIIRPSADYIGPENRDWVDIESR